MTHDDSLRKVGPDPSQRLLEALGALDDAQVKRIGWRNFESLCARLLEENGYKVLGSIWFRDQNRRYQIDVVGALLRRVICIDCKAWTKGGGLYRSIKAARDQKERTIQLRRCMSATKLQPRDEMHLYPMVVTLKSEDVTVHEGVPVVPFDKLNSFIVGFDWYEDELFRV